MISPRTQGNLIITAVVLAIVGYAGLAATLVQTLPRVEVGLVAESDEPIVVTAALPRGYGLTALERRGDWPELNQPRETSASLEGGQPTTLDLGRVSYCVTGFLWEEIPPPLAWFEVRVGDSGERYVVWRIGDRAGYFVQDAEGQDLPPSRASWRITVGPFEKREAEPGERPRYLLHLTLERQDPRDERDEPRPA